MVIYIIMRAYYNLIFVLSIVPFLGEATSSEGDELHIVYMGKTTHSIMNGDRFDPRKYHAHLLNELHATRNEKDVVVYNKSFLGIAARMSKEEAQSLAQRPQVVSVFPNRALKLHTSRSWDFLKNQNVGYGITHTDSPYHVSNRSIGAHDTIIGMIDSGVWPEHPSFRDECMGPIPPSWKGICMPGKNLTNKFICNKKVIGARYYGSFTTPVDNFGHGSHTASTAAGMPVRGASFYGLAEGIARGGSIGSRLAIYRVCGKQRCSGAGILSAFDDAIADGVDLISISLGSPEFLDFIYDPVAIGAFHAMEKGIPVVASAGNGGPDLGTVANTAPWILTVGATTIDRDFEATILLGRDQKIKGGGINVLGLNKTAVHPLIDGLSAKSKHADAANASNCAPGTLNVAKVKGKIVLCESKDGFETLDDKIQKLKKQGAVAIIMINQQYRRLPEYHGTTPVVAFVTIEDGAQIQSYINIKSKPLATILRTLVTLNDKPAPVVPFFSSRGPINEVGNLLKPDVTAPGVGILAAWPPLDDETTIPGMEPPLFNIISGTSMSCPHVSGVAATVKSHNPSWSPSMIRSAIMTSAIQTNNLRAPITTDNGSIATPYDIGAGEISLVGPLSPGLVYETETIDYIHFLCNIGYNTSLIRNISSTLPDNFACPDNSAPDLISDMNYPSIVVSRLKKNEKREVKRTVTNVGEEYSTYTASVVAPTGVRVQVVPNKLQFTNNIKKISFNVTFTLVTTSSVNEDMFGAFMWSNGKLNVRSPIVVRKA